MLTRLRDRFELFDIQVTVGLNPLNWRLKTGRHEWLRTVDFGPFHIAMFH